MDRKAGWCPASRTHWLRHTLGLGLLALVIFYLFAPALRLYAWNSHEMLYPQYRVYALSQLWQSAGPDHYPWLPNAAHGYGWPFFLFYAPLGYAAGAAWMTLTGAHSGEAVLVSQIAAMSLAAGMVYLLGLLLAARGGARRPAAWGLAVATIYTLTPYHLCDLFARGALAECWAWFTLPACLLAMEWGRRRPGRAVLWIAAAVALLLLSHNITALYGLGGLGLYALLSGGRRRWLTAVGLGMAGGLLLSAFFWVPALYYKGQTNAADAALLWGTPEKLRSHGLSLKQYGVARYGHDISVPRPDENLGIQPGPLVMAAAGLGLLGLLAGRPSRRRRRRLASALGVTALALAGASTWWPWEAAPGLLRFIQFPWRLLLPATLGALAALLLAARWVERRVPPEILTGLALLLALPYARAELFQPFPAVQNDAQMLQWYTAREDEGAYAGGLAQDFRPVWVSPLRISGAYLRDHPPPVHRLEAPEAGFRLVQTQAEPLKHIYRYQADAETTVRLHFIGFPGWQLRLDGQPAGDRLGRDRSGFLEARLPAGTHRAEVFYTHPPLGHTSRWVSLATALGWGILALRQWLRSLRRIMAGAWGRWLASGKEETSVQTDSDPA